MPCPNRKPTLPTSATKILHSIWRIAMNLLADKHKNTVDFELKSTVLVALI